MPRHPALLLAVACVCAVTGCGGSSHKAKPRALKCGLQVSSRHNGRAVVTYDDATGDAKMSAAIKAEVAAWNASSAPVELVPATSNAAMTFRAVTTKSTLPKCNGTAPRVVTIGLNSERWKLQPPASGAVKDPQGAVAREIGHALGLAPHGDCPALTSTKACAHRQLVPGVRDNAILTKLYAGGPTTSASP